MNRIKYEQIEKNDTSKTINIIVPLEHNWYKLFKSRLDYDYKDSYKYISNKIHKNWCYRKLLDFKQNYKYRHINKKINNLVNQTAIKPFNFKFHSPSFDYMAVDKIIKVITHYNFNHNFMIAINHDANYYNVMKLIDNLLWIMCIKSKNSFSHLIAEWDYIMVSEYDNVPVSSIIKCLNKTRDLINLNSDKPKLTNLLPVTNHHLNYDKINKILIKDTYCFLYMNNLSGKEKHILRQFINFDWHKLIPKLTVINASAIIQGNCHDVNILNYLKKYGIMNGNQLQYKLINLMSSNHNFAFIRNCAKIGSEINDGNKMYYLNKHNVKKIQRLNMNILYKLSNNNLYPYKNIDKKHYQSLVKRQDALDKQIKSIQKKYDF